MTIKDYLDDLQKKCDNIKTSDGKKLSEAMAECTSVWDNDACRGYLIAAAKRLKMSREKIKSLLNVIEFAFSDYTVDEAAKIYIDF